MRLKVILSEINACIKETQESSAHLLCVGTAESGTSPDTESASVFAINFPISRTEDIVVCELPV